MSEVLGRFGTINITGWWFGTWLLYFHAVGNSIIPTDEVHHFSEGWLNHQADIIINHH